MRTIYCDEAGFTGNRLMDEEQPYFAFAGVKIAPADAETYVRDVAQSRGLGANEVKGSTLCKRPRGRAIVQKVIEDLAPIAQVAFFNKKFALCAKMFEYLIEPAVSPVSSLLYDINFNRFVANLLHCYMVAEGATTESVFGRFEDALRGRTDQQLMAIADNSVTAISEDNFPDEIVTFLMCNRAKIAEEVVIDTPQRAGGWMLELSTTALRSILVSFGEDMEPMDVFCDASKPINDQVAMFDAMIGRTDKCKMYFAGQEHQITFNLNRSIQMVDSVVYPGVQLADIFASVSVFALKNPDDALSKCWHQHSEKFVNPYSVIPQPEHADFRRPEVFVNALIFRAIIDRSLRGHDYVAAMSEIVCIAQEAVCNAPEMFCLTVNNEGRRSWRITEGKC